MPTELFGEEISLPPIFKSTCRIKKVDISRAGRVEAPGGAARRGRARLGANRTIRPGKKVYRIFINNRRNVASASFKKHEQTIFCLFRV